MVYKDQFKRKTIQLDVGYVDYAKKLTGLNSSVKAVAEIFEMLARGDIAPVSQKGEEYIEINREIRQRAMELTDKKNWRHAVYMVLYSGIEMLEDKATQNRKAIDKIRRGLD